MAAPRYRCTNCGRWILRGHEEWLYDKPYGKDCYKVIIEFEAKLHSTKEECHSNSNSKSQM